MYFLKKILFHSPVHYIIAAVLAAAVVIFRFSTLPEGVGAQFAWYDALSVAGYATFLIGALLAVAHYGAFDLFGYIFSPGRVGNVRKYKSYADYSAKKAESRARDGMIFIPYFVVGIVVFLLSFLFA